MNRRALNHEIYAMLVVTLVLLLAFFVVLPSDQTLATRMQHLSNPLLAILLKEVSVFGNGAIEMILISSAVSLLAWKGRRPEAWFLLACTVSAGASGTLMKILVARPRPLLGTSSGLLWQVFGRYSLPSGHTVFYTGFFGAIAFLLWQRFTGKARWAGIALCIGLIVLVGPSRVFLGAHWPSDVVAGYLVGGICLFALIVLYQWRYGW